MATAYVRNGLTFLRWRLIPVRALGKLRNMLAFRPVPPAVEPAFDRNRLAELRERGYCAAGETDAEDLRAMVAVYGPRGEEVERRESGHPFANIFRPDDIDAGNPVFRLAFSERVLSAAHAYFGGRFLFDSIQVLRSFPTSGDLRESQKWHRDYGDSKSLHFIMYLNNVKDDADGPFVFVDREVSKKVRSLPIIRRLTDEQIERETGSREFTKFYGEAGEAILVDPAACYHFGSRCSNPRTAVFITFNTDTPYEPMVEPLKSHRARAAAEARKVRPDLPEGYMAAILRA